MMLILLSFSKAFISFSIPCFLFEFSWQKHTKHFAMSSPIKNHLALKQHYICCVEKNCFVLEYLLIHSRQIGFNRT